jgi:Trk K+ transport system NAD-binding subunit
MSTPAGTTARAASEGRPGAAAVRCFLVVGEGTLASRVVDALRKSGASVRSLRRPLDRELRRALAEPVEAAVVIDRDDIAALRTALLVEYVRPGVRLIVTIFDRTVAEQVVRAIPCSHVLSLAAASVGSVLGPCLGSDLLALRGGPEWIGVRRGADGPRLVRLSDRRPDPARRLWRRMRTQLRPDGHTSRLLLLCLAGLAALVCLDALVAWAARGESPVGALYTAVQVVATVGPAAGLDHGAAWQQLVAAGSMALALVLTAVFTAALVNRALSRRLTGIVGSRTIPRAGHVVVVGLGQVGFRLCRQLQRLGVEVVAVERDAASPNVRHARHRRIPVVIGDGGDRYVLERLSLSRARALAAVTSDELANIAVSVTALAVAPRLCTVLRAGSNDVVRETQALFPIGVAQDLERIAAAALAGEAMGYDARQAFLDGDATYLELASGAIVPFPPPERSGSQR